MELSKLKRLTESKYNLNLTGLHGINHWNRVYENGMLLCKSEDADRLVVTLFAYLHDCCRMDDGQDMNHGSRAADYIKELGANLLGIDNEQLETLCYACEYHNKSFTSTNKTIGTCWDADRLDLFRVGIYPSTEYLSTKTAKQREVIEKCVNRSISY